MAPAHVTKTSVLEVVSLIYHLETLRLLYLPLLHVLDGLLPVYPAPCLCGTLHALAGHRP